MNSRGFLLYMAKLAKSICQHPGCSVLLDRAGRCDKHRQVVQQARGSASERGYNGAWQKARAVFLKQNPLCAICAKQNRVTAASVVDHVIPHRLKEARDSGNELRIKQAQSLFWSRSNWQPLCKHCHDSVKQAEERAAGLR